MKSYIEIQVPAMSFAGSRGVPPGPAGQDPSRRSPGRFPGPVGISTRRQSRPGFLEETIAGGSIILELDNNDEAWRIRPPAYAHWGYYLPATSGKWARDGDEIVLCDATNKEIYFSLKQANKMSGRAFHKPSPTGRYELHTEWRRVPKPWAASGEPRLWYGLAIAESGVLKGGMRGASAIVLSANRWFTFFMPPTTSGASGEYSWGTAFVLLTGYMDRGDLIGHPGFPVDHQLSPGAHRGEQSEPLNQITKSALEDLIQFALKNNSMLRALGLAAVQGGCIDFDEKHVIISDLAGAGVGAGMYAYLGECVPLPLHSGAETPAGDNPARAERAGGKPPGIKPGPPSPDDLKLK